MTVISNKHSWNKIFITLTLCSSLAGCALFESSSDPIKVTTTNRTASPTPSPTASPTPTPTYAVGGTISGLTGSLTIQNNGTDATAISSDGASQFSTLIANGGGAFSSSVYTALLAKYNSAGTPQWTVVPTVAITTAQTRLSVESPLILLAIFM